MRGDDRRSHKKFDSGFEGNDDNRSDDCNNDIDGRGDRSRNKPRHRDRDRHHRSKDKSSNKRRKKNSRSRSAKRSDEDSDSSLDYDRRKKERKSSKSRQERKEKKSAKALSTKKPDKSKLISMGEPLGNPPDSKVKAEEDYFSYNHEFGIYLFREEGTCFNDINTEESRAAFARFAKQYNAGMLEEPYYSRTFPNEVIEESKTTKHSWGFKTTHTERKGLGDLLKGVRRQTEYSSSRDPKTKLDIRNPNSIRSSQMTCPPVESFASVRPRRPTPEERQNERRADRRLKEHIRVTQEEVMGGPKDLNERRLEKKREHAARIHGAHRDHEREASGMELSDANLFGDDGNEALGRSRQKKERRDERQINRIQELKAKEEEVQKNMLKTLGLENLQGREKFEIAPRK